MRPCYPSTASETYVLLDLVFFFLCGHPGKTMSVRVARPAPLITFFSPAASSGIRMVSGLGLLVSMGRGRVSGNHNYSLTI